MAAWLQNLRMLGKGIPATGGEFSGKSVNGTMTGARMFAAKEGPSLLVHWIGKVNHLFYRGIDDV